MYPEVEAPGGTDESSPTLHVPSPDVIDDLILPEISPAARWRALPELLLILAMTVRLYQRKRAYLGLIGHHRKHAVRKARWHIR